MNTLRSREWLKYLGAAILAWGIVQYALPPGSRFVLQPVHHDDYSNLASAFPPAGLHTRPVSFAIIGLVAQGGPIVYSCMLQGLVVLCASMVLLFVSRFLARPVSFAAAAWLFAIVFLHPRALEWGRYTGLMTNLLSACFGLLALLCLGESLRRRQAWLPAFSGAFLMLSGFSKEDYLLPFFAVAAWGAAAPGAGRWAARMSLAVASAVAGLLVLYNTRVVPQSFTQIRPSGPYAFAHSPGEFARVFAGYFAVPRLVLALAVACLAAALCSLWRRPSWRGRALVLAAIPALLVVPYAFLPNHVFPYYSVSWSLWLGSAFLVIASGLVPAGRRWARAAGTVAALALCAAFLSTRAERNTLARWYSQNARRTRQAENALIENVPLLSTERDVGVLGAEWPSPWTMSNGGYLEKRLGLKNRWVVFAQPGSQFFPSTFAHAPDATIEVRPLERVADSGSLLFLVFDGNGNAVAIRHQGRLTAAEIEAAAALAKKVPPP